MHKNIVETVPNENISKGPFIGMRHVQAVLLFLDVVVLYISRIHVAITLVAMTNAEKSNPDFPEYDWNEQQKSYILSSFFWGYVLTQFPGAFLTRRLGAKISLFIFTMATGLLSALVPFCVSWGRWQILCLLLFLQGIFQGGLYPTVLQHLAKWSPPTERGFLSGIAHTGLDCSIVAGMALSGLIATSTLGWPGTFYIYAGFCFIWCVLWLFLGANDANTSRFITKEERFYIEDSLKDSVNLGTSQLTVPWRAIFTSKPFYALLAVRVAAEAGIVTLISELPSYMNSVLKLNMENNSLYSALPFVGSWIFTYIFTYCGNLITKRNLASLTVIRKYFNSFGMWVPSIGIFLLGFFNERLKNFALITCFIVLACYSSINMGCNVCQIDMAPNHADIICAIVNTFSYIIALLGPLYFGLIFGNEGTPGQWQIALSTIAIVFCIGDLIFIIWGTAKEQPWNAANYDDVNKNESEQA